MTAPSLTSGSDDALLKRVDAVVSNIRRETAQLLVLLIEVEDARADLRAGYPSMFEFCVRRLGLSEGETYRRLAAAAVVRKIPKLLPYIQRNEVHLSRIALLREHLTADNLEELLTATRGMSNFQVQEVIAGRSPKPDVPGRMRKLPAIDTENAVNPAVRPSVEPRAEDRYRLQVTISREVRDMIERARDRMSHVIPNGDLSALVEAAFRALDEKLERKRFGETSREPKKKAPKEKPGVKKAKAKSKAKSTGPSDETRRRVFKRDGEQCTYRSADGRRCSSRKCLELDHIISRAKGGSDDEDNLRVRCRAHNGLHAEDTFGKEHVRSRIEARQRKAAAKKRARAAAKTT